MKNLTYCEDGYFTVVPVLKTALILKLVNKGLQLREACKYVNMSITAFERHKKNDVEKIQKIIEDKEISDMINSLSTRIINRENIDSLTFCLLCSKARRLFNLPPCF
ncbi:hypothetical protein V6M85_01275 [Sulfolobus tengchongensis]|uniref:Transcriptional regulator n=1 Tax=Sulfolobus tengchongensis TaxID=207809 RepID=A0AAX4L3G4_9CREN